MVRRSFRGQLADFIMVGTCGWRFINVAPFTTIVSRAGHISTRCDCTVTWVSRSVTVHHRFVKTSVMQYRNRDAP